MPHYNVVIETRAEHLSMIPKDVFIAGVASGVPWRWECARWRAVRDTPAEAYRHLCGCIRKGYPKHTFDFLHVAQGEDG